MNADLAPNGRFSPQAKLTDLGSESTCRLPSSASTIAVY